MKGPLEIFTDVRQRFAVDLVCQQENEYLLYFFDFESGFILFGFHK